MNNENEEDNALSSYGVQENGNDDEVGDGGIDDGYEVHSEEGEEKGVNDAVSSSRQSTENADSKNGDDDRSMTGHRGDGSYQEDTAVDERCRSPVDEECRRRARSRSPALRVPPRPTPTSLRRHVSTTVNAFESICGRGLTTL